MKGTSSALHGPAAEFARVLREHLPELRARYSVTTLGLFGSYVRGEQSPGSDLDLLVEFASPPDLLEFVALRRYVAELLGVNVDLVMRQALTPRLARRVIEDVVPI